ncbi:MAG: hypothetical protein IJL75_02715 [Eubacterium sp.]|nr:hypothetical protein [Eubacterium sp.]
MNKGDKDSGKKILILMLIGFVLLQGCTSTTGVQKKDVSLNKQKETEEKKLDNKTKINDYFPQEDNSEIEYIGNIWFRQWGVEFDKFQEIKQMLCFKIIKKWSDGFLCKISLKKNKEFKLPKERNCIGYFYIEKQKIIRLVEKKEKPWIVSEECIDSFIKEKKFPKESIVVCSDKDVKDTKEKEKKGWHNSISINGDTVIYKSNQQIKEDREPYFWEKIVWKRDVGIIEYRCGYKAGVDYIILENNSITSEDAGAEHNQ